MKTQLTKLVTASEIARKARVCDETLRRKIAAGDIDPDALLITGRRTSPLYTLPRARCILKMINSSPELLS
jgi:hypothetical protein